MSKDLFLQLREEQVAQLYPATFTKKEALKTGLNLANEIIENGNVSKHTALANLIRLEAVISTAIDELKQNVADLKTSEMGMDFTPTNGRKMIQFQECEIYAQLSKDLKEREELLKLAQNQEMADLYGNIIPKVSVKFAKDSLTIKY
jgi:hypothetical protein